ncbi:MAG: response regulator [Bacteroidetes bacterium]|nr:response regulator [Bacteroidota bacterium]
MAKTILVVDDSESIREVVGFTLQNEGFTVIKGNDGRDALKCFDGRPIDLVITDLYMPEMDGLEFIREIRNMSQYKHIPILFLTTESQLSKKLEAKDAGATGWIIKPFVPEKLMNIIRRVIR